MSIKAQGGPEAGDAQNRPKYGLGGFVLLLALSWLTAIDVLGFLHIGSITGSGLFTVGTFVTLVFLAIPALLIAGIHGSESQLHRGVTRSRSRAPSGILLAFLAYVWLRILLDPSPEGIQNGLVYGSFILAIFCGWAFAEQDVIASTQRWAPWLATLTAAVFLIGVIAGTPIFGERSYALVAILYVAMMVPNRSGGLIVKLGLALVVVATAVSLSRTALFVVLAELSLLVVRSQKRRVLRWLGSMMLVGAATASLLTYYAPLKERFLGGDQGLALGSIAINTSGRSNIWSTVWKSSLEAPVFGHGAGTASKLVEETFVTISHPHNDYLRLFHDFGLVGLGAFLLGYIVILVRLIRHARRSDGWVTWSAAVALGACGLAMWTDNVLVYSFVMVPLGFLVGIALGDERGPREQRGPSRKRRSTFSRPMLQGSPTRECQASLGRLT